MAVQLAAATTEDIRKAVRCMVLLIPPQREKTPLATTVTVITMTLLHSYSLWSDRMVPMRCTRTRKHRPKPTLNSSTKTVAIYRTQGSNLVTSLVQTLKLLALVALKARIKSLNRSTLLYNNRTALTIATVRQTRHKTPVALPIPGASPLTIGFGTLVCTTRTEWLPARAGRTVTTSISMFTLLT